MTAAADPNPESRPRRTILWIVLGVILALAVGYGVWSARASGRLARAWRDAIAAGLVRSVDDLPAWQDESFGPIAPEANGATAVLAAAREIGEAWVPEVEWPEDPAAPVSLPPDAVAFLESHTAALAHLDAARAAPRSRLPIDWNRKPLPEPPVLAVGNAADLVRLDAARAIVAGDTAALRVDVARLAAVARTFEEVPMSIAATVHLSLLTKTDDLLRRLLLVVEDPVAAHAALAPVPPRDVAFRAVVGDNSWVTSVGEQLEAGFGSGLGGGLDILLGSGLASPWLRDELALVVACYADLAALRPLAPDARIAPAAALDERIATEGGLVARLLAMGMERLVRQEAEVLERLRVTRLGAGALAFAAEHDRWPASPAEMDTEGHGIAWDVQDRVLTVGRAPAAWRLVR